jgi:hypothetical protein
MRFGTDNEVRHIQIRKDFQCTLEIKNYGSVLVPRGGLIALFTSTDGYGIIKDSIHAS